MLIRNTRPASGADTTYFSRMRVLPSSSTVTSISPLVASARSTSIGSGTKSPTNRRDNRQPQTAQAKICENVISLLYCIFMFKAIAAIRLDRTVSGDQV